MANIAAYCELGVVLQPILYHCFLKVFLKSKKINTLELKHAECVFSMEKSDSVHML